MRFLLNILLSCTFCVKISTQIDKKELDVAFKEWKCDFVKNFTSNEQETESFMNFAINYKFIQNHNKKFKDGSVGYNLGLWEESDQPAKITSLKLNRASISTDAKSKF